MLPAFCRMISPAKGLTLIVGSEVQPGREDRRGLYPKVIGIDLRARRGVDEVLNLEDGPAHFRGKVAHVECVSVLEHARRPWALAQGIVDALQEGGTLTLSVPWVWRFHAYPNDLWRFTPEGVKQLFHGIEWERMLLASNGRFQERVDVLPPLELNGNVYFERTEILAFGRKPCAS